MEELVMVLSIWRNYEICSRFNLFEALIQNILRNTSEKSLLY